MKLLFIDQNSQYYKKAIDLRISLFFNGMENANELICDSLEDRSEHLIYLKGKEMVGTGRLTIEKKRGIISQMAIKQEYQKKGIGSEILLKLLDECSNRELEKITLSARKTAIDFYEKFGFEAFGDYYESEKTGVIHQNMSKEARREIRSANN